MLGKVTATKLNVRSQPNKNGKVFGTLARDAIVEIRGEAGTWFEIGFNGASGFVATDYIQIIRSVSTLKGRITAPALNVRRAPSLTAPVLSTLSQHTLVNVVGEHPGWIEIEINHATGFVARNYVELIEGVTPKQGTVTVDALNVRAAPERTSDILGRLAGGSTIPILTQIGSWYETRFNGVPGYVHADYVATGSVDDDEPVRAAEVIDRVVDEAAIETVALVPATKYQVAGTPESQKVALTWNKFGGLLQALADHHQVDVGCAVAVLCVESSGKGFEQDNQNRMIIRFENHKFWEYWGKRNADKFNRHFRYNDVQRWQGHQWRALETDPWENFHGNQLSEWRVLEFARALDDTAALYSISMGAPQIMGFHYARTGYPNVQQMFDKFAADIRHQIVGFFDFLNATPGMIQALRDLDFIKFAGLYNGSGQKEKYGAWIRAHYDANARLIAALRVA